MSLNEQEHGAPKTATSDTYLIDSEYPGLLSLSLTRNVPMADLSRRSSAIPLGMLPWYQGSFATSAICLVWVS